MTGKTFAILPRIGSGGFDERSQADLEYSRKVRPEQDSLHVRTAALPTPTAKGMLQFCRRAYPVPNRTEADLLPNPVLHLCIITPWAGKLGFESRLLWYLGYASPFVWTFRSEFVLDVLDLPSIAHLPRSALGFFVFRHFGFQVAFASTRRSIP
jgi:hypothetical protein